MQLRDLELADRDLEVVIKELRATLGKMELALGSIDEAIVWTGEDTGIQWCNATFDRLVNQSHIAVLGNRLCDLLPLTQQGERISSNEHPVFKVLAQDFQTTEYEFEQSNRTLILEISGSYLELKNGDKSAVITIHDITERKRIEEQIRERNAQLASANEEISILNEKLKEDNLRLGTELDIARQIQQMILPKTEELEAIAGLDIAGYMEPADEVGGDYYDVLHTEGIVTLGIGDVTGHGLESGLLMLMTQTAVRTLQEIGESDPVKFLDTLNRTIYKNVQRMNSEKSLTLVILNYAEGELSISGQHEETLIVHHGGQVERIDTMDLGFPIGLYDDIASFISHTTLKLQPGEGVVLYTDGIPEAKDIDKVQYGVERLCEVISEHWHQSAQEIKKAVITDVRRHIGKQKVFDDITLLVLKRQAEQPDLVNQPPKAQIEAIV